MNASDLQNLTALRGQVERIQADLTAILRRIERLESEFTLGSHAPTVPPPLSPPDPTFVAAHQAPQPVTSGLRPPPLPASASEKTAPSRPEAERSASKPGRQGALEMRIGVTWLVRLGILMLLTALVYAGWYAWDQFRVTLGPGARVAALYAASFALLGVGLAILKTQGATMRAFAQVIIAGGLAALYYVTYAAHHVNALKVIASPALASLLLAVIALAVVWTAIRWESPLLASAAFALAFYTSIISGVTWFSLASNIILALAAMALQLRRGWSFLSFVALIGTYGSYLYWSIRHGETVEADAPSFGILTTYWLLFTLGAAWPLRPGESAYGRSSLAIANSSLWAALAGEILHRMMPNHLWLAFTIMGAVHLGIAAGLARHQPSHVLRAVFALGGAAFLTFAIFSKFSGEQLALLLAMETLALAAIGTLRESRGLRLASVLVGFVALVVLADAKSSIATTCGCAALLAGASLVAGLARRPSSPRTRWDEAVLAIWCACALLNFASVFSIPWQRALPLMLAGVVLAALPAIANRPSLIFASLLPFLAAAFQLTESTLAEPSLTVEALYPATLFAAAGLTVLRSCGRSPFVGLARILMLGAAGLSTVIFVFRWYEPVWQAGILLVLASLLLDRSVVAKHEGTYVAGLLLLVVVLISLLEAGEGALRASLGTGFALLLPALQTLRLHKTQQGEPQPADHRQRLRFLFVLLALLLLVWSSRFAVATFGSGALTAAWGIAGFVCLAGGLAFRERALRFSGLAILALALGRVAVFDVWMLDLGQRLIVFVVLGVALTVAGFIYNRMFAQDAGPTRPAGGEKNEE